MITLYVISMAVWVLVWSFILLKFFVEGGAWEILISFGALLTFPVWPLVVLYYMYVRYKNNQRSNSNA